MSQCICMYQCASATYPYTQVHSCKTHTCRQAFLSGVSSCQVLLIHAHIKHSPRHSAHAATPSTFADTHLISCSSYSPLVIVMNGRYIGTFLWQASSFPLFVITQGCCNRCILKGKWLSGGERELKLKFAPRLLVTKVLICWGGGNTHSSTCAHTHRHTYTLLVNNAEGTQCAIHTDHSMGPSHTQAWTSTLVRWP